MATVAIALPPRFEATVVNAVPAKPRVRRRPNTAGAVEGPATRGGEAAGTYPFTVETTRQRGGPSPEAGAGKEDPRCHRVLEAVVMRVAPRVTPTQAVLMGTNGVGPAAMGRVGGAPPSGHIGRPAVPPRVASVALPIATAKVALRSRVAGGQPSVTEGRWVTATGLDNGVARPAPKGR